MNRSQRRKAGKADRPKTYILTHDQIDRMKLEAVNEAALTAFRMFMAVPIMVLHDKFGFGRIRGQRFMDYAVIWYESIQNGETSLEEIMRLAEELTGVKVVKEDKKNEAD